jgi:hypothetical protein
MKNREPNKSLDHSNENAKTDEMQGFLGLEMKKEALKLARRLLEAPYLNAELFRECLIVVENFVRKSKRWQTLLEKAYSRLNPRDQEKVRTKMLIFYSGRGNTEAVLRFLPKRLTNRGDLIELLITWETWLDNDRMEELEKTIPIMSSAIRTAKAADMSRWLSKTYARYWAKKAELVRDDELDNLKKEWLEGISKKISPTAGLDSARPQ